MTKIESALLSTISFFKPNFDSQPDIRKQMGWNQFFKDVIRRMKSGIWKQALRSRERFRTTERRLCIPQQNNLSGSCDFIPPKIRRVGTAKAHESHKNATERAVQMLAWWPRITQDMLVHVCKCRECQANSPSLRKTLSTSTEAEILENWILAGVTLRTNKTY